MWATMIHHDRLLLGILGLNMLGLMLWFMPRYAHLGYKPLPSFRDSVLFRVRCPGSRRITTRTALSPADRPSSADGHPDGGR